MKFSCDRCGKKYATAETPAPGRVYKLKCKACGHLIVVKTPANAPATTPTPSAASSFSIPAAQPPEIDVEIEAPPPLAEPPAPPLTPAQTQASEPTAEISMMTPVEELKPAGDGGYVDIFADSAPPPAPAPVADDPFLRASQGGHSGQGGLVDPFADMRSELEGPPAAAATSTPSEPASDAAPASYTPPAHRPADEKKKGGLPMALIGIGFAAILGIVVVVALKSGKKVEPPPPPPPPLVVKPAPTPPPEAPAPEPVKAEPEKPKAEPKPQPRREERKEEKRVAKVEPPKAQPKPPPPPPPPPKPEPKPVAKAEPEKQVQLPDAASALSPEAVQRVVNASRRAFESCIADAAKRGTETKFDGRKVALRLNVNPNGFVTYPTLDDVTLNRTELGECLKAAARLMVFPKFQGDVFHVEVPLTLRGG